MVIKKLVYILLATLFATNSYASDFPSTSCIEVSGTEIINQELNSSHYLQWYSLALLDENNHLKQMLLEPVIGELGAKMPSSIFADPRARILGGLFPVTYKLLLTYQIKGVTKKSYSYTFRVPGKTVGIPVCLFTNFSNFNPF